jgi:hypothetical protein
LQVYFCVVLGQQVHQLINYGPIGQSIVHRRAVDLLALPLDAAEFFLQGARMTSESVSVSRALPVELGMVSPEGGTVLYFIP